MVKGQGPSLLRRNWLQHLKLNWHQIMAIGNLSKRDEVLACYHFLFSEELGEYKGKARILIDPAEPPGL